jgi:hypothetical protein
VGAGSAQPAATKRGVELADIFRAYGESHRRDHPLPVSHLKVIEAMERCRTAALGGHLEQCNTCGYERPAYNSCRNRHGPKCQSLAKVKWLNKQKSEILPVGYFHLVFTLPHELNGLILTNKKILLSHLLKAVGETLVDFGHTRLGGQIGFITVLHTWDQTLLDHFHLHCLVPAGALSYDQKRWTPARKNFLFPVKALSVVFRGKFLDLLKSAFAQNKLLLVGQTAPLADPVAFQLLINALRKKPWIVYAKKPFGSPVRVLDYLGRYTHRVALSNDRILSAHNGEITFSYRDRKNEDRKKTMTLDPTSSFAASCSTSSPKVSCACVTSGFWPTAPQAFLQSVVNSSTLILLSPSSLQNEFTNSCSNSPASISLDALYAKRERWSSLPTSPHHGILRDDRSTTQDLCASGALCQSLCIGSPCPITSPFLAPLSRPLRHTIATNRCPVFSRPHCAAMLAQVDLIVTIPIDKRRWFTHRFSPTGFILNAPDPNYCRPIAIGSHSG